MFIHNSAQKNITSKDVKIVKSEAQLRDMLHFLFLPEVLKGCWLQLITSNNPIINVSVTVPNRVAVNHVHIYMRVSFQWAILKLY